MVHLIGNIESLDRDICLDPFTVTKTLQVHVETYRNELGILILMGTDNVKTITL